MTKTIVSELELLPVKFKSGLTYFANCILDNKYFVGNIAVYSLRDGSGFRLVYPTKTLKNGQQIPIFYPIDKNVGEEIQTAISRKALELAESIMEGGEIPKNA